MMQQTLSQDAAPERRVDLDWVRIAAFGLLILYHVGMFYVPWNWHIKSAHPVTALEPLMLALNPWRLALLFLVSGVATRFMLRKTPQRLRVVEPIRPSVEAVEPIERRAGGGLN